MGQTVYTEEQRAIALDLLENVDIWAACQATGANHGTIYRWHAAHVRALQKTADPTIAEEEEAEQAILRTRLQRRLLQVANAHLDRSDSAKDGTQALRYMTAAAIAVDKYRLERGETTSRTEVLAPIDLELARLLDEHTRQS